MFGAYSMYNVNQQAGYFSLLLKSLNQLYLFKDCHLREFEEDFSRFIGVKRTIGVSSARFGLLILLKSLGLNKGDEIILSAYNFYAIPAVLKSLGIKPVFVDVDEDSYNINVEAIEERITNKTKALIVTHLFGLPCNMDAILNICSTFKLILIEDCADSCGASYKGKKVGSFGEAALFSFSMGKNIYCLGGGAVTFNNQSLHTEAKKRLDVYSKAPGAIIFKGLLKYFIYSFLFGKKTFPFFTYPALRISNLCNFSPTDFFFKARSKYIFALTDKQKFLIGRIQARLASRQLDKLEEINFQLVKNAELLNFFLKSEKNIIVPQPPNDDYRHIYVNYRIQVEKREEFIQRLLKKGIFTFADNNMVAYSDEQFSLKIAKKVSRRSLQIPNSIFLNRKDIEYIAEQIRGVNNELNG